eukprot:scaffold1053_cov107-Isochrysis_galbana.AAC.12
MAAAEARLTTASEDTELAAVQVIASYSPADVVLRYAAQEKPCPPQVSQSLPCPGLHGAGVPCGCVEAGPHMLGVRDGIATQTRALQCAYGRVSRAATPPPGEPARPLPCCRSLASP